MIFCLHPHFVQTVNCDIHDCYLSDEVVRVRRQGPIMCVLTEDNGISGVKI